MPDSAPLPISLSRVSFAYSHAAPPIVRDVDLAVPACARVVLVGVLRGVEKDGVLFTTRGSKLRTSAGLVGSWLDPERARHAVLRGLGRESHGESHTWRTARALRGTHSHGLAHGTHIYC